MGKSFATFPSTAITILETKSPFKIRFTSTKVNDLKYFFFVLINKEWDNLHVPFLKWH